MMPLVFPIVANGWSGDRRRRALMMVLTKFPIN